MRTGQRHLRPSLLIAGTVLLACLPGATGDPATSRLSPADVAAGLLVAVIAVRLLAGLRTGVRWGWLPFGVALASFALATVTASDVSTSVFGFIRYAEIFVLVPVAVALSVRDRYDLRVVAGAFVTIAAAEGAVGVHQYLTGTGASYAGEYVRAIGTFGPEAIMALATLLGYGIVVALALGLAAHGPARPLLIVLAGLLLVPLALTLSRGAWIATAVAVLAVLAVANWRVAAGVAGAGALLLVTLSLTAGGNAANGTFVQRVTSIATSASSPDQSVLDRYALWRTATAIWADHPVLGVGIKDFAGYRDSYASVALSAGSDIGDPSSGMGREPLQSAHNQYLQVLSEQGTIGLLAFGGLLAALAVSSLRRVSPGPEKHFLDLAAPGIIAWTLIDFVYGDLGGGPAAVLLAVLLGLAARRALIVPATRPVAVAA
ncbi:O-antigen ligase family protein [Actinoplanes oblitus]|uniref:O-antigen ligase family protein n=1 Tax=Actinoplanes oblitus TaxID=3040509 RepID=A0ABY8W6A5_9ACTN|nr:O-antigen ligase family protein [Actinoplanes oblitus]WIM92882.1 O-antigen ligase family protein [Actinoplanes oblitus]